MMQRDMVICDAGSTKLLGRDDLSPVGAFNLGAVSPFLIVCDHAGTAVPPRLENLGLPKAAFQNHIGCDLGVRALAIRLCEALGAGMLEQTYSRLVIDCNRPVGHPGSVLATSDGWSIPGNLNLSKADVGARVAEIFRPYHESIAVELDTRGRAARPTALICLHSFTPILGGEARPWHVGVLHMGDSPLSEALLGALRSEPGLVVGDNQPYAMDGTDFTAPHHARGRAIEVTELEIRQDLIADAEGQAKMAALLARVLPMAMAELAA